MSIHHIRTLRQKLTEAGADAAIFTDKLNQRYLSDFDFDDGYVLVTRENAYLITDFRYIEAAKACSAAFMTVVDPGRGGMMSYIAKALRDDGCKTLLFEEETLAYANFERYRKALPDADLESGASAILTAQRLYKDEKELDAMARAQAVTDAAFDHIVKTIRPDEMTEVDVALELEYFMRSHGASSLAFDTIAASGSASSRPHAVPRPCKLERGFLTMDYGAKVDGYCSDMTRTVVLGKADADMKKLYNTVLRAQTEALAAAREGASCFELDKIARDVIDGAGYEGRFGHSLGHGVGLFIHEKPSLSQGAGETVLQRGHTFTVEPGIYIEGLYGCRIEDMCCIRPGGTMTDFTHSPKELIEI